ncbi:hypothetical protein A3F34_00630 [Candidatus Roizmanbacteria bacterium RIFCSPHIGHO2_12_FULL_44_10]|uniref:(d)CMP kinase n=1 Tax=Candidatus Roizmanbacteria bacterium RIFCSPHIGHO2_12_FULL_44_10 TaxID=1802054 RepID=A0A1F7I7V4_9BACT|nr:MAG: hypothetical protein A3F34_00630 [Candidatus Roizmanbacteria bacterium RIFCSPHIGHO2_12_FULL_44_10]
MAEDIPRVLKILLTCKEEERFNRFAEREKVSHEEAKRRVLQRENHVLAKINKIHGRDDIFAPNHYNMVIDTTGKNPQEILQAVLDKLT